MKLFAVRVRDAAGRPQSFRLEAESRAALLAALRREGLLPLGVEEVRDANALPPRWHPAWLRRMTEFDVELGLRQLAALLRSGVPLLASLRSVSDHARTARGRLSWRRVADHVYGGGSFATALAEQPRHFGEIVVRLAEVGERSGELERTLARAADQLEARRGLKMQVVNALVYPVLAVLMAIGVSVFLVVAVIPKVAEFLKTGGAQLPGITQLLMDFSDWFNAHGLYVAAGAFLTVAAWMLVRLWGPGREAEDVALMRVPVAGRILRLSGTALFARSMQIMTEAGVTLLDALSTAASLMQNRRLRRRVASVREGVLRGRPLAEGLQAAREFMPMLGQMTAVGETTGALAETFGETARFHEMMLAVSVKRFGMLIEPTLICVTGGIVGFVYIAFFMAIFAMAGTN